MECCQGRSGTHKRAVTYGMLLREIRTGNAVNGDQDHVKGL